MTPRKLLYTYLVKDVILMLQKLDMIQENKVKKMSKVKLVNLDLSWKDLDDFRKLPILPLF